MRLLFIMSASIALEKAIVVLKNLTTRNIIIDCIVTDNAKKMINCKDINTIIKGKVYTNRSEIKNKMLHINLTRIANLIVVCPSTANLIAKFSNGYADDLASTSLIASNKQIIMIPAMNSEMWNNYINQKNVSRLIKKGVEFIGPEYGNLSCGELGLGRLSEPKKIINILIQNIKKSELFKNKTCLITAGPTIEPIDSIRYISNYSSGKQGYEIARQMILLGAKVILISGPTNIQAPYSSKLIKIKTGKEMMDAVKKNIKVDIAIFAAAVSDISPIKTLNRKIKKEHLKKIIFKKNDDILHKICSLKKNRPKVVIGFAAETNNAIQNAKKKLLDKKCDAIILNKIDKNNKIFGKDMNKVSFIYKKKIINHKKTSKINVAKKITLLVNELLS